MLRTSSDKQVMNPLSMRMPAIANRLLSQMTTCRSLHSLASQTREAWICERCSLRKLLSTGSKRAKTHAAGPMARPLHLKNLRVRTSSTSNGLRDTSKPRSDLPSQEEGRRSHASKRFDHLMDNLQSNIFVAGQRLNDLTGYSGIEVLKKDITQQGLSSSSSPLVPFTF